MAQSVEEIFKAQREFLAQGNLHYEGVRKAILEMMATAITKHLPALHEALKTDLGKCETESYMTETGFLLTDIRFMRKRVGRWMKPRRVPSPLFQIGSSARVEHAPRGVCVNLSPWNYPVQLALSPAIAAIAAGNTVIIKPSEFAPACAHAIQNMVEEYFEPGLVSVIQGGPETSSALIDAKPDFVFFTGSTQVGAKVAERCARQLIPYVLELGGKNHCIVEADADLRLAAKRIAWGKFMNAGQTCVAPDTVYVDARVKSQFIDALKAAIVDMYAPHLRGSGTEAAIVEAIKANADYPRIVSGRHVQRLAGFLDKETVHFGGVGDEGSRFFSPTIIDTPSEDNPISVEEIFGPILPVVAYEDIDTLVETLAARPKPLAVYVFTRDMKIAKSILRYLPGGGACINDVIMHLSNHHLPFGGIGESGSGWYHGYWGFRAFSHTKAVLKGSSWIDPSLRYPPYEGNLNILKKFLK